MWLVLTIPNDSLVSYDSVLLYSILLFLSCLVYSLLLFSGWFLVVGWVCGCLVLVLVCFVVWVGFG